MNKKKIWIPVVAALLILAAVVGIAVLPRMNTEPVPVYAVKMVSYMGQASGSVSTESYGVVTAEKVESIYVSDTQTVTQIHVYQGQRVKKGDLLYSYDTTLSDLSLQRKDLAIQQMEINLKNAQEELKKLKALKPMVVTTPSAGSSATTEAGKSPSDREYLNSIYAGSGTSASPYKYWISQSTALYEDLVWEIINYSGRSQVYVIFQMTQNDAANASFVAEYGVKFETMEVNSGEPDETEPNETEPGSGNQGGGGIIPMPRLNSSPRARERIYVMSFFPVKQKADTGGTSINWNSGYTQAELVAMREEKANEIAQLEFNIRIGKAELKIMEKEASDGKVYAAFDGVVLSVLEPANARELNVPMMKIAGGGGYYVEGTVSELARESIREGQSVTVNCWDTGMTYTGSVAQIGSYPVEQDTGFGTDSVGVTYYPYKVFIDESADLQEGSFVSLTYAVDGGGEVLYLENAFIHTEGKNSYVFVRNGEGLLEKRLIQTGTSVDGYATPVYSGLEESDYIAFPYSRETREGAQTTEAGIDQLYGQ